MTIHVWAFFIYPRKNQTVHSIHQSTIFDKAKPIARWGRKVMGLVLRDSRAAKTYRLRGVLLPGEETAVRGGTATRTPHLRVIREVEKPGEHVEIMRLYEDEV
jgi:hypothetical protein